MIASLRGTVIALGPGRAVLEVSGVGYAVAVTERCARELRVDDRVLLHTAMVVHVYQGHKKASVVSIPRDTLIERPDCTDDKGTAVAGGRRVMFNTAYEVGGPACAVKTVEKMSGIRMDHYVEIDFSGFANRDVLLLCHPAAIGSPGGHRLADRIGCRVRWQR